MTNKANKQTIDALLNLEDKACLEHLTAREELLIVALRRAYHALHLESRTREVCKGALLACGVEV